MSLTNSEAITRWVTDLHAHGKLLPRRGYSTRNIRGHSDHLTYDRFGLVVLARFLRERRVIVLNGDGMRGGRWRREGGGSALGWQTELRSIAQRILPDDAFLIIPFQAIQGANIQIETLRPIAIRQDTMVTEFNAVPTPPVEVIDAGPDRHAVTSEVWIDTDEGRHYYRAGRYSNSPITWSFAPATAREIERWRRRSASISFSAPHNSWGFTEQRHQLGESLFSAVGEDGKRHKFLSGFDNNEPQPLYFLAQLPDGSGAKDVEAARQSLAPPIVHSAWKEHRTVLRQGDVFFIATDLTTEEIYAMAARRVRRECVLFDQRRPVPQWPSPVKGEVRSLVMCPCNCGHSRWSSDTPRGRRTLSIYGTAHSATEIVVTKSGATYARGQAHHDPILAGETRRADHAELALVGDKWYLAVRNTVPRRRVPRPAPTPEEVTT